ncbi:TAT-variant-translocated molybdopterin oxidoreductase [Ferruginibacter lapsinanis]|uniref:TAT-variant-translocated molybdopterin oxidoreductase n=1 Tax=Ferruginibacter lapsinanis TaxID=563172 RepID=UPI001E2B7DDF|nr:TAT-variant-translocated molybdopterin oxidoreductase [Ferruginibacter lapsinanis]UEG50701.1 TAT-variant-translocated molybdopterin oxidoreductase [Ferruginibacter lapsinanis]
MSNKKYWQNFGELNQTEAFEKSAKNEFQEDLLPLEELDNGMLNSKTPRRDFLKYLGFSTAAATLAASCEMPVRKAVPYLHRPDNIIPGVANYYASTYVNEGDVIPVVVKQRDGRPIKIEGNELSTITNGGTSAQAQASVLDLYDTTRLRYPQQNDGKGFKEVTSFDALDKLVATAMAGVAGKPVIILSSTINSPSTEQVITEFLAKQPAGSRHVQYDAISYSGMLLANEACYGKKAIPSYHFDAAKVIVSIGADFLGTWLNPVEFSTQYAKSRKISGEKPEMSRHIQFESTMSLTGSNADDRFVHKPSQKAAVALALLAKLGGAVTAPAINDAALVKGIETAAAALTASKGAALVVCGSNDVNLQIIVNAINEAIGANGKTIDWSATSNYRKGIDADITKLVDEMNAGAIGALLVYESNPVYTYYDSKKFAEALKKVPVTISFNGTMNETTELCKFSIPSHHWLESFGDAEPKTGYISLIQPTINPLFKTRAFQTSLLKWSGSTTADYETYFKTYWTAKLAGEDAYNKALQDGVIEPATPAAAGGATFSGAALAAAAAKATEAKGGKYELVIYQKVSIGSGKQANNPWLQELPDPISKVTWDNYAMMSPALAKTILGIDVLGNQRQGDGYEVQPEKPTVKITVNGKSIELPVLIIPGVQSETVAVALGYGRQSTDKNKTAEYIGLSANGAGANAYPLVGFDGTGFRYSAAAEITKTGNTYAVAQTQVHGSSESRPVIYETTLAKFIANPEEVLEEPNTERVKLLPFGGKDFRKDATIYPDYEKPGIKWGMSIDLNTCTGCSACVVACTAENNVAVVGKTQVMRAHEMHWLRIDRYFTGDMNNPDVVFQPMLCQHCDNAPCENVCPVAATNHSSEGLNQMTYNRCIGTRYCANNCPFKVRRFNWLDYTGADSFGDNQNPLIGVDLDETTLQMNDDLTRMVLNPDVTVRSRGVIEKCSFCVQRLQENKLIAKKAEDPSLVRNVKTACMQACPTHSITFGNVNDKESEVSKLREDEHRTFYVLEQLHVLPNVSYQVKIKNTDRNVTNEKEAEGHGEAKAEEKAEAAHH